jgi:peptidoglycan/xylan/chitin deacetylase (PgdA/CDA1 family)
VRGRASDVAGRIDHCVVAVIALGAALLLGACGSGSRARSPAVHEQASASPAPVAVRRPPARSAAYYRTSPELRRLIALGRPIYCAGHRGREIALTFDDGPGPYTRLVIAKLRKHRIRATFFVVGRNIRVYPGRVRAERTVAELGDHTFDHPLLTALSPAAASAEIGRAKAAIAAASGAPVVLFRPPYGGLDPAVRALAREQHLLTVLWNVDSADSLGAEWRQIERNVIAGLRPGSIILMHENHGQTVRALLGIFAAIERRHLRTVTVPQLLADDPPTAAQLRAGGGGCRLAGGTIGA